MKPRANQIWFKQLTSVRERQLWLWLNGDKEKSVKPLTIRQAAARVRRWGIKATNPRHFSAFYSWYGLQLNFQKLDTERLNYEEFLRTKFPNADPETIQQHGQAYFTMQAMARGDAEEYREMEKLRLQKEKEAREASRLSFDKEKFEVETCELILKAALDPKTRELAESGISHGEMIAQTRKAYFRDIDSLQKSGKIKLPE